MIYIPFLRWKSVPQKENGSLEMIFFIIIFNLYHFTSKFMPVFGHAPYLFDN